MKEIILFLVNIVVDIITKFGYIGVLIASALESACIPLPSEVIFPFSGFVVHQGNFNFWLVIFYGMIGQILGSLLAYYVGYFGALPILIKYGKYILIKEKEIKHTHDWFEKHGESAVFFGRILPVIRTFISLPAGIAKMNIWKFLIFTTLGCLPWLIALTYSGVFLGQNWIKIKNIFLEFKIVIIVGLLILLAVWIYHHLKNKNNEER